MAAIVPRLTSFLIFLPFQSFALSPLDLGHSGFCLYSLLLSAHITPFLFDFRCGNSIIIYVVRLRLSYSIIFINSQILPLTYRRISRQQTGGEKRSGHFARSFSYKLSLLPYSTPPGFSHLLMVKK